MKILYSAGNRSGASLLLKEFMDNCPFDLKVAGYDSSIINLDWTLNAVRNKYSRLNHGEFNSILDSSWVPLMDTDIGKKLLDDVNDWDPDLVICDYEGFIANIASGLNKELWYSSPVHLLDGFSWPTGLFRYKSLLEVDRKTIAKYPKANRYYVNSPFSLLNLPLKKGYEWLCPMGTNVSGTGDFGGICLINNPDRISILSKILNCVNGDLTMFGTDKYDLSHLDSYLLEDDYTISLENSKWLFCCGESTFITDGLRNGLRICVTPNLDDPEALLNGIMTKGYHLGDDLGCIELMKHISVEYIDKSYNGPKNKIYSKKVPTLLEKVVNYESML